MPDTKPDMPKLPRGYVLLPGEVYVTEYDETDSNLDDYYCGIEAPEENATDGKTFTVGGTCWYDLRENKTKRMVSRDSIGVPVWKEDAMIAKHVSDLDNSDLLGKIIRANPVKRPKLQVEIPKVSFSELMDELDKE